MISRTQGYNFGRFGDCNTRRLRPADISPEIKKAIKASESTLAAAKPQTKTSHGVSINDIK